MAKQSFIKSEVTERGLGTCMIRVCIEEEERELTTGVRIGNGDVESDSVNTLVVMGIMELVLALVIPSINAQVRAPAAAPSSDVIALDQGIAYLLMLFALLLTYIIH